MRLSLTRTVGFRAVHRLFQPDWPPERNRERFGSTAEAPGHSHDYSCAVTVTGPLDLETATLIDLALLDRILDEEVIRRLDGRHLNLDLPEFASGAVLPTCEALARDLFVRIAGRLPPGVRLERVRVAEDPTLYADCTGLA